MTKKIDFDRRKVHSRPEPTTKAPTERVKSDAIVQHGEGVGLLQHTAKTLGKHLGDPVWVDRGIDSFIATLISVDLKSDYFKVEWVKNSLYKKNDIWSNLVHKTGFYPILKTVTDLTEEDRPTLDFGSSGIFDSDFKIEVEKDSYCCCKTFDVHTMGNLKALLDINAGAIPDKDSPTGYISLHDLPKKLPCKRWEAVFG